MTANLDIEKRLEAMETAVAHQDHALEQLSDVLVRQSADIADLATKLEFLKGKLEALETGPPDPAAENVKPPHY